MSGGCSACTGCSGFVGLILIALPVIIYQINPSTPFGRTWGDDGSAYCRLCTILGGIGGIMVAKRDGSNSVGYVWAAGMFAGAITSYLSYIASVQWVKMEQQPDVNVFILMICAIPGLIVFACIKRCSDYTFPEHQYSYTPVPEGHTERSRPRPRQSLTTTTMNV